MNVEDIIKEIYIKGYEGSIEGVDDIIKEYCSKIQLVQKPHLDDPFLEEELQQLEKFVEDYDDNDYKAGLGTYSPKTTDVRPPFRPGYWYNPPLALQ